MKKHLSNLKIDYELVNYCEIDKYASRSYSLIHGIPESMNLGDITKVDTSKLPKDIDLITYGFPCQDISLSGKLKGFEDNGKRTRSGLFFEALRIIEECKPKIAIAENVRNLTSKRFKKEFEIVLSSLEEAGYNNYWKILNAKDYGIPQHRERVFIISIRKDFDLGTFDFPKPFELQLKLNDMLEDEVSEKYLLNDEIINKISYKNYDVRTSVIPMTSILIKEATKKGYTEANEGDSVNLEHPNSKTRRGRVGKQVAQTLTTSCNQGVVISLKGNLEIRKFTPKECWRLMGFNDEDCGKAAKEFSNTQLYKQAGNSIVVNVLEHIFNNLFFKI